MSIALVIVVALVALGAGSGLMYVLNQSMLKNKAQQALKDAEAKGELLLKNR
jgi:hypothetical protein